MDIIDREVVWNEVFEVWNTLDLVFDDLRNFFFEGPTTLRHIYEILWILGENSDPSVTFPYPPSLYSTP